MLRRYKITSANDAIPGFKCSRTRARPPCASLACVELQVVPYARPQPCILNSPRVLWLAEGVHIGVRDKPVNALEMPQARMLDYYCPLLVTNAVVLSVLKSPLKRSGSSHTSCDKLNVPMHCIHQTGADHYEQAWRSFSTELNCYPNPICYFAIRPFRAE